MIFTLVSILQFLTILVPIWSSDSERDFSGCIFARIHIEHGTDGVYFLVYVDGSLFRAENERKMEKLVCIMYSDREEIENGMD